MRVPLQRRHVALAELPSPFSGKQQEYGFAHQRIDAIAGQLFLGVERFVHRHDQLRNRPQPGKPRITGNELKKMMRRLNRAHRGFVNDALGIEQRLVQVKSSNASRSS